jgi:probable phosphoglycerate mutase
MRRLQGSVDTRLNANGVRQAESWRSFFDRTRVDAVYSSGLDRALHTASLATGRVACIIDGFNERRFGEWEGCTWPDLESGIEGFAVLWNDNSFRPAGGESRCDVFERVRAALAETVFQHDEDDQVLIVAHGASGHAILATLLNQPIEARGQLPTLVNASLSVVDIGSGGSTFVGQIPLEQCLD